jgi:type III secretion protein L
MAIGKVIKGDAAPESLDSRPVLRPPRGSVVNAEEFQALTESQKIIHAGEKRAQEIIEAANAQRDEIFAQAATAAREEVLAQAATEIAKAKLQAGQILANAEGDLVALACQIANKIIRRDLERDPELLVEICATAIDSVRSAKSLVLRVNPRDGALLREKRPKLMELIGRTLDISIKDDPDVEEQGCVLQTEFGTIDAQLKTQFEMLKNVLVPDGAKKEGPR